MTRRSQQIWAAWIVALIAGWGEAHGLRAESVIVQIKSTVDHVVEILKDRRLQADAKKKERRERLRQVIAQRFDFEEMAKRSLGQHWRRNAARKDEFVPVFTKFVEESYIDSIETYKNEKIVYTRERIDKNFAQVSTKVITGKGDEIPIDYRLHSVGGEWKVYDVVIENVSLVNNYRSQFHRILDTASFDDLIKKLQEKSPEAKRAGLGYVQQNGDSRGKEGKMARRAILETTLGDLIAALTDEMAPFVRGEKEINRVVAYILADLLYNSGKTVTNRPVSVGENNRGRTLVVH